MGHAVGRVHCAGATTSDPVDSRMMLVQLRGIIQHRGQSMWLWRTPSFMLGIYDHTHLGDEVRKALCGMVAGLVDDHAHVHIAIGVGIDWGGGVDARAARLGQGCSRTRLHEVTAHRRWDALRPPDGGRNRRVMSYSGLHINLHAMYSPSRAPWTRTH